MIFTDEEGNKWESKAQGGEGCLIEPVKKSEKKTYILRFHVSGHGDYLYGEQLDLTKTTAHKLSEAISALVEYVQTPISYENPEQHISAGRGMIFDEARKSYQESQDD